MNKILTVLMLSGALLLSFCMFSQNTSPYWSLAGNSNASISSRLGTTTSVPLRLVTNNAERLRIDINGKVGIGGTTPNGKLTVFGSGGTPAASWVSSGVPIFAGFGENMGGNADHILAMASNVPTARAVFLGRKARGTLAAPAAVQTNDYLLSLFASGYDGGTFQSPAAVDLFCDGTPSAGNVPARISFSTGSNASNRRERLKIGSTGDINLNNGQLFVRQSDGHVSIGTSTPDPNFSVTIKGGDYGTFGTGGFYGFYALAVSTGVYGEGQTGIFGNGTDYGVYGENFPSNANAYAGFFAGDVFTVGMYQSSDAKLKQHVAEVSAAVDIISQLHPKTYEFRQDGSFKLMHLPGGMHYGLIAQDLEKVLPNLVKDSKFDTKMAKPSVPGHPSSIRSSDEVIGFKAVNYTELIPILVKAVQELEARNKQQDSVIDRLEKLLTKSVPGQTVSSEAAGSLGQNIPNPGASVTTIPYRLPSGSHQARLALTDIAGRLIQSIPLSASGAARLSTSSLPSGVYHYSLIIDNRVIDTKQMLITR
ncbi:MAG: tail fiber domain-containing protein [Chitinophagaceae bacterium]|nr:tail fiber domain-containing protein [Chitinophagaceae bacterium]